MTRLQVLPLPTKRIGDREETPFILVLDEVSTSVHSAEIHELQAQTGALMVMYTRETIDLPAGLELTEEQRENLGACLMESPNVTTKVSNDTDVAHVADHAVRALSDPRF